MKKPSATALAAAALAVIAFLPFLRGVLAGRSFYFRDLSVYFFPLRRFVVEGLLRGELRFWNPYVHEGEPLSLPPVSYPLDLLQVLVPDERGFTLLLALHVPLCALAFLALGRALGLGLWAAAGGALVYALGGFGLSTLNLYVYLQAMAWSPLLVLGLLKAAAGDRRHLALAALATAVALSTTGIEIVAQAALVGLVLALTRRPALLRLAAPLLLGAGLAASTLLFMSGLVAGSERGRGFPTEVVLAHSIHPLTLVQVVVADWHGDLADLAGRFWGQNFFPRGFPYLLSLYLGAAVLAVAAVGGRYGRAYRGRLLALAAGAALVCLGRWAGLAAAVEALPILHVLRYPVKAYFTVHLAVALLAAFGLQALREGRGWRLLTATSLGLGGALAVSPWLPGLLPAATRWFISGFFPPEFPLSLRLDRLSFMLADAARGGALAVAAGALGARVLARRLEAGRAGPALVFLLGADLLRAGAGLNPMVTQAFFELSPEMTPLVAALREGRVFTCDPGQSPSYHRARLQKGDEHEVWTFLTSIETLTPHFNVRQAVRTALSPDLTMLVPVARLLPYEQGGCANVGGIVDRLRAAAVSHVLSLDPLDHADLALRAVVAPARISPLVVSVHELARPLPLREVPGGRVLSRAERPGHIALEVEASGPTRVVVREAYASGWTAAVNGAPAALGTDGRHLTVPVGAGRSRVVLSYAPPRAAMGLGLSMLAAAVLLGARTRHRKAAR